VLFKLFRVHIFPKFSFQFSVFVFLRVFKEFFPFVFRMNLAIKAKSLDPMDLKLLPNTNMEGKAPRLERYF